MSSERHAELLEHGDRRLERREVGAAAADDADDGAVAVRALGHRSSSAFVVVGPVELRQRLADALASARSIVGPERREVAHLATFEDLALVVEVEVDGRIGERLGHAEQPGRTPRARSRAG